MLQKRFNEFNDIYKALKDSNPDAMAGFKFPSKTISFGQNESKLKETRREKFNEFVVVS